MWDGKSRYRQHGQSQQREEEEEEEVIRSKKTEERRRRRRSSTCTTKTCDTSHPLRLHTLRQTWSVVYRD